MSNTFSSDTLDPEAGFTTGNPSVSRAASDLRAAAQDLKSAAGDKARDFAHQASDKAHELKDKAVAGVQQFASTATDKAAALKSAATEKAQQFRETAQHQWEEGRAKAKDMHVSAEDYIRQNPTKCVLGALGAGFLIGLIVRR